MISKDELLNLGFVVENEYLDNYINLINQNENTKKESKKTQAHHIVPKYVGLNDQRIVNLSYKNHVLAHYYLCLCSSTTEFKLKNCIFLKTVYNKVIKIQKELIDINQFDTIYALYWENYALYRKLKHQKYLEQQKQSLEIWKQEKHVCEKCGKIMTTKYGSGRYCCKSCAASHPHTFETKQLISNANKQGLCGNKGKHLSEEHKRKIGQANTGKVRTNQAKENYKQAHLGQQPVNSKKVRCIETGEIFPSMSQAAKIYHCSVIEYFKNKIKHPKFHWEFVD